MERSAANELVPTRALGAAYSRWGERWQFSVGLFGESLKADDEDNGVDEGWGGSGRFTAVPISTESVLVHAGVAVTFRKPDGDGDQPDEMRFRTANETAIADVEFLDTGRIRRVKESTGWGLELAASAGPFYLQGEHMAKSISREEPLRDVDFSGGYAQVAWLGAGAKRNYDNTKGEFGGVQTAGRLAWEVAARYSWIDLSDPSSGIRGGKSRQWTLGVSLYPNDNLRFILNLSKVNNDRDANANRKAAGGEDFGFIQARAQVVF